MAQTDYLRDKKALLCLNCTLEDCNEGSPDCLWSKALSRKEYFAENYRANKARKIENAKRWRAENPERYREYQAGYKQQQKERRNNVHGNTI